MNRRLQRYGPVVTIVILLMGVATLVLLLASGPGNKPESSCDGPNMVYRDRHGAIAAVAANDPRCTGREGTQS